MVLLAQRSVAKLGPRSSDALSKLLIMKSESRPPIPDRSVGIQWKIMAFVYILKSLVDGRFYIGSTINLQQRLIHHFSGATPTTKRFGKIELVLSQEYKTLKEARRVESRLKKLKRKDYIEKIVSDGYIKVT